MTKPNKILIKASHSYNAKPERIFEALVTPEKARTFMFATFTGKMIKAEIDARVGGHFTFMDRRPDGDAAHYGRFVAVEAPKRLAFEFSVQKDSPKADLVTIDIEPLKKGCRVTLTHEAAPITKSCPIRSRTAGTASWTDWARPCARPEVSLETGYVWTHDELKLVGYSVAGVSTCIAFRPPTCASTSRRFAVPDPVRHHHADHGHMDHAGGIAYLLGQKAMRGAKPTTVYLPAALDAPMRQMMQLWGEIEQHATRFR